MSFARANGSPIQQMSLTLVSRRAWAVTGMLIDAPSPPAVGARVTIELPLGRFVGTVTRSGADAVGQVSVEMRGGAAQLSKVLGPRNYIRTTVGEVAKAIADESGETLSPSIAADVLGTPLARWGRTRGDGEAALGALATRVGATWRVLPDGTVWIGKDSGAEPTFEGPVDIRGDEKPGSGFVEVALECAALVPGQTWRGKPVVEVTYELAGASFHARVVQVDGGDARRRKVAKQAEETLAPTKLHPCHRARVLSQNPNGTLELKVDSPDVAPISEVPIRHGLPGVTKLEMEPQAEVALFFENGDPEHPFAALFAGARTTRVILDGERFELGGDSAVAMATPLEARITAIETYLKTPGPVIGPAPLAPIPLGSTSLFAKGP